MMVASATGGSRGPRSEMMGRRIAPCPWRRGPRMGETGIVGRVMMVRVRGVGASKRWAWIAMGEVGVRWRDATVTHSGLANMLPHL